MWPCDAWPCDACARLMGFVLVPSVALWARQNGNMEALCQRHLDVWFDNAEDGFEMEPYRVDWLDHSRSLRTPYRTQQAA